MPVTADVSKQHTLVMLSGGIDSVYVLYRVLRDTDDVVWAHHVNLVNVEGRHRAESAACARIVDYCGRHLRPFRYTESTVDHTAFEFFGRDVLVVAFEAGIVMQNANHVFGRSFGRWMLGYCKEESEEVVGGQPVASSNRRSIMEAALRAAAHPFVPPPLDSSPALPKAAQIQEMPLELARLAWTCRKPVWKGAVATECGGCKTCKLMEQVRAQLAPSGTTLPLARLDTRPPRRRAATRRPRRS